MLENGVQIPIKPIPQNMNWETIEPLEDWVNAPKHYHQGGIDLFKFMEMKFPKEQIVGFHRGNIMKYLIRYQDKGGVEDLKKARRYLDKLIEIEAGSDGA